MEGRGDVVERGDTGTKGGIMRDVETGTLGTLQGTWAAGSTPW